MLQKDKSATTSSASATSKSARGRPAKAAQPGLTKKSATPSAQQHVVGGMTPVQFVKGVGPGLGAIFESRGIKSVKDLLTFFPRAYEDRSRLLQVAELKDGIASTVAVQVISSRKIPLRTGKSMLEVRCSDSSGTLSLKWFHAPRGMDHRFSPGTQIIVTGQVKNFMGRPEIVHPEITFGLSSHASNVGRVVPVYIEIEGVPSRLLRKILWEALEKYVSLLTEDLPERFLLQHQLPRLAEAVRAIHFPPEEEGPKKYEIRDLIDFNTPAHWRLIYEEFFKFEYLVLKKRLNIRREAAPSFGLVGGREAVEDLTRTLPFTLTRDQKKSIDEILGDLAVAHPMNRLIQGDVGSGKTAVAFLTAGMVLAEGGQATLMAPTEILAEQHYKNAIKLFGGKLNVALLTGKTSNSDRSQIQSRLAAGEPILMIGTHALLEDPVAFKNLVYVMIDEQHRFGVDQRRILREKGTRRDPLTQKLTLPHTLILTATPIPRTLALTAYGDLSVSTIKELPPGRSPIVTKVIRKDSKGLAYERIRDELKRGHQAYFIYPLINESEAEGFTSLKSAVNEAESLAHEVFPDYKVGLLHGQLRSDEKALVMEQFKRNEIQVLVSTTVVEVGVDVPNATIMVIEHAERFGLSQLHQLRGRVGRGSAQSYCFLFAAGKTSEITTQRLEVLEETGDGFKIAEADLEIRGPGEFLGTRQSGGLPFRLANLVRDRDWLIKAREDVKGLLLKDPNLDAPENLVLKQYLDREGSQQFEWLKTS